MSRWRSRGRSYGDGWGGFAPYVPVAERRAKSAKAAQKLTKKGQVLQPVQLDGRTIARSFWGKAWCDNLESYSDYANRMPRGRTYVRNGSVLHLEIKSGLVEALVSGSHLYKIKVGFKPVDEKKWRQLCKECAGGIGSLMELLAGKLSDRVMGVMTRKETGLFPAPSEIELNCSCPDWADMCKHVAAVLYGVGARLDETPELLFTLRGADHRELVSQASAVVTLTTGSGKDAAPTLAAGDLSRVFGIELDESGVVPATAVPKVSKKAKPRGVVKPVVKKKAKKKPARKTGQ
ncbi:MAG: SWIM zinc finger family protein [bacterium]